MPNLNTFQPPGGLEIFMFPALQDNYCYLVRDPDTGKTGVIDTPEVAAIERALAETGWTLDYILNTHHHADHAGGNVELKKPYRLHDRRPEHRSRPHPGHRHRGRRR